MSFVIYNKKAALQIEPSRDIRKSPPKSTVSFTFAPFKANNPTGLGQTYDWTKSLRFAFQPMNAHIWANSIKLALKDNLWGRCSVIHKYNNTDKILSVSNLGDTYFINSKVELSSLSIAVKLETLLTIVDYVQFTSLNQLKVDDEATMAYRISKQGGISYNVQPGDFDTTSDNTSSDNTTSDNTSSDNTAQNESSGDATWN